MGDPDGEAVKTAKNVPGSEGHPCRRDATGRNGIASPPEGNAYGSRRYISGEATEQGTRNRQQRIENRYPKQGLEQRQRQRQRRRRRQGQKNVRASAKGCPEPRNQSGEKRPASKPATHATGIRRTAGHSGFRGKSLPEQKKAVIFATRNPEGSPGRKCPGLTHDNPVGLHKANHGVRVGNDGV